MNTQRAKQSWMRYVLLLSATLQLLSVGACSRRNEPAAPVQPESHTQMQETLHYIALRADDEHHYLGTAQLRKVQRDFGSMPSNSPPLIRFEVNRVLGRLEMLAGKNREGIEHLTEAHRLLPEVQRSIERQTAEFLLLDLALAYSRVAEAENCVHCETGESCLFPIREAGVHAKQFGSEGAVKYLRELLEFDPQNLTARWMLNVALMTLGRHPQDVPQELLIPLEATDSEEDFPRFENVAAALGLNTFTHCGGSIIDDFDGDGCLDIVVSTWHPQGQLRLYHNNADGTFSERTDEANLTAIYGGLNLVQADYDNDGDIDIYVLRGSWLNDQGMHPNSLLQNDGQGRFVDVTYPAGLAEDNYPSPTAAWADFDNDGHLDLFVGNEGYRSQLYRNNGNGTFTDVALRARVLNQPSPTADGGSSITKGAVWGDYNGDRWPDLYVSNLGGPNKLYRNDGKGHFIDVAPTLGVAKPIDSFPLWFWDFNNDGNLDIFVSSWLRDVGPIAAAYLDLPYQSQRACLYMGDGNGGFEEVADQQNLKSCSAPMGANFGDLDNDGFLDFYLGTGWPEFEAMVPNLMFRNRGGTGFSDVTTAGGFGHLQKGHGISFADLDNDGDQDVFIEIGGAFRSDAFENALFENPGNAQHWIKLKLVGQRTNRCAIGARIHIEVVEDGENRSIYKHVNSGGSFGANPLRQEIGLGHAERINRIEIYWPTTDTTQAFKDVDFDQAIQITEGQDSVEQIELKQIKLKS